MAAPRYTAGQLRDRIRVEKPKKAVSDGMGNTVNGWTTKISDEPAAIMVKRGGESVQGARLTGKAPIDIVVRYSSATAEITSDDRIINERTGHRYSVEWAGDLANDRRWLTITCLVGGSDE